MESVGSGSGKGQFPELTPEQKVYFDEYVKKFGTPMKFVMTKYGGILRDAMRCGIPIEDIEQEAWHGVVVALRKFDPARGVAFPTFAHWWVLSRVSNAVREATGSTRRKLLTSQFTSLDAETSEGASCRYELIGELDNEIDSRERVELLNHAMQGMDARRKKVLRLYYGIGCEAKTLRGIGESLGVSKERARQILEDAMSRLRRKMLGDT